MEVDVHGGVVTEFDVAGDVLVELGEESLVTVHVVRGTRVENSGDARPCRKLWIRR